MSNIRTLSNSEMKARRTIAKLIALHEIKTPWRGEDMGPVVDFENELLLKQAEEREEGTNILPRPSHVFGEVIKKCEAIFVWPFSLRITIKLEFHRITVDTGQWLPVTIISTGCHPETRRNLTYTLGMGTLDGQTPTNYLAAFLDIQG